MQLRICWRLEFAVVIIFAIVPVVVGATVHVVSFLVLGLLVVVLAIVRFFFVAGIVGITTTATTAGIGRGRRNKRGAEAREQRPREFEIHKAHADLF